MRIENAVQQVSTPLYQQLLVLIPLLKFIEDSRRSGVQRITPLRLDVTHRTSGALTIAVSESRLSADVTDNPEMAITIQSHTRNSKPLTYNDTLIFARTLFSNFVDESERDARYEPFMKAWWTYVLQHEQTAKSMGLA